MSGPSLLRKVNDGVPHKDRLRGCAVGAAIGDALGMPLEFGPMLPADRLVRDMRKGRLPAGTFTDDTEMALALAGSLRVSRRLDAEDVAKAFVAWHESRPPDEGIHTRLVLDAIAEGKSWKVAARDIDPSSAGNGSLMRCWPVALAFGEDMESMLQASRTQSEITHAHPDCVAACAFANAALWYLARGHEKHEAVALALDHARVTGELRAVIEGAPGRRRTELKNSGWVRHTVEAAVWGLLATNSFEEAVVQVVNLGNDADTAGSVVGALSGAAYGLDGIPVRWRQALRGEWPIGSGRYLGQQDLIDLADALSYRASR